MQADRFTIKSQEALQAAIALADERRNPQVTPEHLLAVLLEQDGGIVVAASCASSGVARRAAARARSTRRSTRSRRSAARGEAAAVAASSSQVLRAAEHEMRELKDEYVSTEHLLLALAGHSSKAGEALRGAGATKDALLQALAEVRGPHRVTDQSPEDKYQALEKFGRDLTEARRARASSTRSSAATTRSAASSRSSPAARRTTPSSSASPASARPRSSRASPSASSPATCPSRCATARVVALDIGALHRRARSTAASSRTG